MGYAHRPMIRASVLIAFDPHSGAEVLSKRCSLPEVRRAHTTSGRFDMLVEIAAQTTANLDRILDQIDHKSVKSSESLIYLTTNWFAVRHCNGVRGTKKSPQRPVGIIHLLKISAGLRQAAGPILWIGCHLYQHQR